MIFVSVLVLGLSIASAKTLLEADKLREVGKCDKAVKIYEVLQKKYKKNDELSAYILSKLAECYENLGELELAIELSSRAVDKLTNKHLKEQRLSDHASFLIQSNRLEDAEVVLKRLKSNSTSSKGKNIASLKLIDIYYKRDEKVKLAKEVAFLKGRKLLEKVKGWAKRSAKDQDRKKARKKW